MIDPALDRLAQRKRLALPRNNHNDLATVEDGPHADGERHARDPGDVVPEEARVREDRVVRERLDARARGERGACVGFLVVVSPRDFRLVWGFWEEGRVGREEETHRAR